MEGFSDWFWSAISIGVPLVVVGVIVFAIVKILAGNDRYKSEGWGHFKTLLALVTFGIVISLFFPSVREKITKMMEDPCQLIGITCRR
jgi:Kef-type K+ transport system membrane component KefB